MPSCLQLEAPALPNFSSDNFILPQAADLPSISPELMANPSNCKLAKSNAPESRPDELVWSSPRYSSCPRLKDHQLTHILFIHGSVYGAGKTWRLYEDKEAKKEKREKKKPWPEKCMLH